MKKNVTPEDVCALLGSPKPRPIQITETVSKKDRAHHIGTFLTSEEHAALNRGVSALRQSGVPMNKSAFMRLAIVLAAEAYAGTGAGYSIPKATE